MDPGSKSNFIPGVHRSVTLTSPGRFLLTSSIFWQSPIQDGHFNPTWGG